MLNIGDVVVSSEPAILETVLGSCVSICLWDEKSKTGGMNHFMLPDASENGNNPSCYGTESITRLIGDFLKIGGDSRFIKAKVFGGGRVIKELTSGFEVGEQNIKIAKNILMKYNIPVINEFTGIDFGIKVVFYTATGKVFIKRI